MSAKGHSQRGLMIQVGLLLVALVACIIGIVYLFQRAMAPVGSKPDAEVVSRQAMEDMKRSARTCADRLDDMVVRRQGKTPEVLSALAGVEEERAKDPCIAMDFTVIRYDMLRAVYLMAALTLEQVEYRETVIELLQRLVEKDKKDFGNAAKVASSCYRMAEMSGAWASSLGVPNDEIQKIYALMRGSNTKLKVAHYQIVNGLYRTCQLLGLAAKKLGVPEEEIAGRLDAMIEFEKNNTDSIARIRNGFSSMESFLVLLEKHLPEKRATPPAPPAEPKPKTPAKPAKPRPAPTSRS